MDMHKAQGSVPGSGDRKHKVCRPRELVAEIHYTVRQGEEKRHRGDKRGELGQTLIQYLYIMVRSVRFILNMMGNN